MANVKISQLPSATTPLDGTEEIAIVQNNQTVKTTTESIRGGYKVYTALLTQSGVSNYITQTSGTFDIGVTYAIDVYQTGDDFSNVGGPPSGPNGAWDGYSFVATGTTPLVYTNGTSIDHNTGAPVVTVLENTIGNIWFTYGVQGLYYINSDAGWNSDKLWYGVSGLGDSGTNTINPGRVTMSIEGTNPDMLIVCYNNDYSSLVDQQLNNTPIEIRVYN